MGAIDMAASIHRYRKAKKLAEENPPRAGSEHLLCYGTIPMSGMPLMTLHSPYSAQDMQKMLAQEWSITSQQAAGETLVWLRDGGHRQQYGPLVPGFVHPTTLNAPGRLGGWKPKGNDPTAGFPMTDREKVTIVYRLLRSRDKVTVKARKSKPGITEQDFGAVTDMDAWDIERIGIVARFSFTAGYLSETDTYGWLSVADQMCRQRYRSWTSYGLSYLVGRAIAYDSGDWAVDDGEMTLHFAEEVQSRIIYDAENSPWVAYPLDRQPPAGQPQPYQHPQQQYHQQQYQPQQQPYQPGSYPQQHPGAQPPLPPAASPWG
jgi:hypothetical protein